MLYNFTLDGDYGSNYNEKDNIGKRDKKTMRYVDMHSHILPKLDDGSRSMEQSLAMLEIAWEEGIETIIATPHNMPGKGCPSRESLQKRQAQLMEMAAQEGFPVEIRLGTEYFFRQEVVELMEQEEIITLDGSGIMLVEFDPLTERSYIINAVKEILGRGYTPMLAHVERYASLMEKKFQTLSELRKMGALLQINCGSVIGDFGRHAKKHTRELLKMKLVACVGTDAHSDGKRSPRMKKCASYLYKKCGEEYAEYLLSAQAIYGQE